MEVADIRLPVMQLQRRRQRERERESERGEKGAEDVMGNGIMV